MSADYFLYAVAPGDWDRWDALRHVTYDLLDPAADELIDMTVELHHQDRACLVGEVSYTEALGGDVGRYIPGPVSALDTVLRRNRGRELNPARARALVMAMNCANRSIYRHRLWYWTPRRGWFCHRPDRRYDGCGVARPRVVKQWLAQHLGARLDAGVE